MDLVQQLELLNKHEPVKCFRPDLMVKEVWNLPAYDWMTRLPHQNWIIAISEGPYTFDPKQIDRGDFVCLQESIAMMIVDRGWEFKIYSFPGEPCTAYVYDGCPMAKGSGKHRNESALALLTAYLDALTKVVV